MILRFFVGIVKGLSGKTLGKLWISSGLPGGVSSKATCVKTKTRVSGFWIFFITVSLQLLGTFTKALTTNPWDSVSLNISGITCVEGRLISYFYLPSPAQCRVLYVLSGAPGTRIRQRWIG